MISVCAKVYVYVFCWCVSVNAIYILHCSLYQKPWLAFCKWPSFFCAGPKNRKRNQSFGFLESSSSSEVTKYEKHGPAKESTTTKKEERKRDRAKKKKNDNNDGAKLNLLQIWLYVSFYSPESFTQTHYM